jgi:hypothetical protein
VEIKKRDFDFISIDSERDKNVEVGGHMFDICIPISEFELLYNRMLKNDENKFHFPLSYPIWNNLLPVLVLEGTGPLDPYLKTRNILL